MLVKSNNSQDDWKLTHKIFEASERKIDFDDYVKRWDDSTIYFITVDSVHIGYVQITPRNEIGYFIIPKFQGKGYGKKAVRELMEREDRKYYWVMIPKNHEQSIKFITKLGFEKSGDVYAINKKT